MSTWRLLVVALVLALAVAGIWALAEFAPRRQSCRLPDGSELSLAKVTFGKKHEFQYDSSFQRFVHSLRLPFIARPLMGTKTLTTVSTNGIVVWMWCRGFAGRGPVYHLAVADDHGFEAPPLLGPNLMSQMNSFELNGWDLGEWPRRSKTIHLRVYFGYSGGSFERVAEFAIANPWRNVIPGWRPEALPATKGTNDLELTLLQLKTGLSAQESFSDPAWSQARTFTRAEFAVKEAGEPIGNWTISRVTARSPWGEYPPGRPASSWSNLVQLVDFPGVLWLEEPAWRLRAELSRSANFRPWETWHVKDVPVPDAGKLIEMRAATNMCGMQIEFRGISGADAALGGSFTAVSHCWNVHLRYPYPVEDVHIVLADAVDDRGHHAERLATSSKPSVGAGGITWKELLKGFAINIPEGAKTLDLTFAVTRSQYFEFLVKPTMAPNP